MNNEGFHVRLPAEVAELTMDNEFFFVKLRGKEQKIRLHEYGKIYKIKGLYEYVVSHLLKCVSPEVVADLLIANVNKRSYYRACKELKKESIVRSFIYISD